MDKPFDADEARDYLLNREKLAKEELEKERLALLEKVVQTLKKKFSSTGIEVYLVGSITQPYKFTKRSDIDLVLKNFEGDHFDVWTEIEKEIERDVEVILYEKCHFRDHIKQKGLKVL